MWYKNIAGRFLRVTDRRTDGRTDGQNYDSQDNASITASRGKTIIVLILISVFGYKFIIEF